MVQEYGYYMCIEYAEVGNDCEIHIHECYDCNLQNLRLANISMHMVAADYKYANELNTTYDRIAIDGNL